MRVCKKKWGAVGEEKRVPRVMHERMRNDSVRAEYGRETREKIESVEWEGESDECVKLAKVMVSAASEV